MTSPKTEVEVTNIVHKYAVEMANDLAQNLMDTAKLLEDISSEQYGLLITSLRWHASRTASNEFLDEFSSWILLNSPKVAK